ATNSCIPLVDYVDVKDNTFYNVICEMYTKYHLLIKDNIKKINSPVINKYVLRNRTLLGTVADNIPVSNNIFVELQPVFYLFGLLLPHITRIVQIDMYGMFEQISNLSDNRTLSENELKLLKMTSMNDVKILDLDDTPLTYEQQVNILIYLNMFLHVVTNSLFKIDKDELPKMVEQSVMNQFNSIIETKFKLPAIYDKLNHNDPYHVKVLRKIMLSFGIRPIKIHLKSAPLFAKNSHIQGTSSNDDLEDFVDCITIPYEKIDNPEFSIPIQYTTYDSTASKPVNHLSIYKFLDKSYKPVNIDNKLYWAEFNRAYGFFPVFINRRDPHLKKDYEQLLTINTDCCELKFNTTQIDPRDLFCPYNIVDNYDTSIYDERPVKIKGQQYFPFIIMGVFLNNSEKTASIEDVEFLYINSLYSSNNDFTSGNRFKCPTIKDLIEKFDKEFFCGGKTSKNSYQCSSDGDRNFSFDTILSKLENKCCDQANFESFQSIIDNQPNVGLLYTSNRSCSQPIFVVDTDPTPEFSAHFENITTVKLTQIECLISSSATTIIYLADIDC
ncbi:MAG: hypothetical protein ACK5NY_09815, partial [Burkholderiaceae bacterium]